MATDYRRERMAELAAMIADVVELVRRHDDASGQRSAVLREAADFFRRLAQSRAAADPAYDALLDLVGDLELAADRVDRRREYPAAAHVEQAQHLAQALSEEGSLELMDAMSSHLGREVKVRELATLLKMQ
jgi:hypothetical protein